MRVSPNITTIRSALTDYANAFTSRFTASVSDGPGTLSWPLAAYSYFIIHTKCVILYLFVFMSTSTNLLNIWQSFNRTMADCAKARALLDYIIWTQSSSEPIDLAAAIGYAVCT